MNVKGWVPVDNDYSHLFAEDSDFAFIEKQWGKRPDGEPYYEYGIVFKLDHNLNEMWRAGDVVVLWLWSRKQFTVMPEEGTYRLVEPDLTGALIKLARETRGEKYA